MSMGLDMHVGFLIRRLSAEEIEKQQIYIPVSDREMFPNVGVLFFIEIETDIFGAYLTSDGYITGLEEWFEKRPVIENDYIIISKYSEGYLMSTSSELVKKQMDLERHLEQILTYEPETILCPNCRYVLEYAGTKGDNFKLKCPKCGFTLVRKIKEGQLQPLD